MEPLADYHSIDNDELAARFMVARTVPIESTEGELEDLWREHDEAMEEFRARWEERPAPGDLEETSPNLLDLKLEIARRKAGISSGEPVGGRLAELVSGSGA